MRKRMVSKEQQAFLNLQAAVNMARIQEADLSGRLAGVGRAKQCFRSGLGMLERCIMKINDSVPELQLEHFERQKVGLKMIVGIKAQLPRCPDAEFGRWLSFTELDVVATAIREACRTCTIDDPQEQRRCPFGKLLEVLPTNKPDEYAPGCGYFTIWG